MSLPQGAPYPECRLCPLYQGGECFIASSRILLYFYCPASEGFRPESLWAAVVSSPRSSRHQPYPGPNNGSNRR